MTEKIVQPDNDEVVTKETVSEQVKQMYQDVWDYPVMTFSDFDKVDRSGDAIDDLNNLHWVSQMMLYNIADYSPDKITTARTMVNEYYQMANAVLDEYSNVSETKEQRQPLLDKLKALVSKVGNKMIKKSKSDAKPEIVVKENGGLMIWKDNSGTYRWLASYSNCYRDDDNPAEIIAKESHENFVDMVDNKETDFPELWHWHIDGSAFGKADWVAFDDDNGVAMAAGYIYPDYVKDAELIAECKEPIALSHGMPASSIVRDTNDPSIIVRHITKEISVLPLWAAANKLTSFYVFKENEMAIPTNKKEYLTGVLGLSTERVESIEAENANKAKFAKDNGIESKEAETVVETEAVAEVVVTETVVEDVPAVETVAAETVVDVNLETKSLEDMLSNFTKLMEANNATIAALTKEVNDLKEKEANKEKDITGIPTASLGALIAESMSVTRSKEAVVRKNSTLGTSGPVETEAEKPTVVTTGNSVFDQAITDIVSGR
jgi:hypothetical protein